MSTVEDILQAVRALKDDEYVRLREALDEMDKSEWEAERARAARDWAASGMTDDDIDAAVMRLRYENRP
jgi:uncharacterized membrane protein